jgi:RNA-directed DNA polymerase
MASTDRYLVVHNLAQIQRQAGVDPDVAELVTAYARLRVDAAEPLTFDPRPFAAHSPELARFAELRRANRDLDERFIAFLAAYSGAMTRRGVEPLLDRRDLAQRLGFALPDLTAIAAKTARLYREIRLPKTADTFRVVHSPREPLRGIQRWIQANVLARYQPHGAAHGFVAGRSILTNARPHVGRTTVVAMDIEGFFPSITWRQVRKAFEQIGYPHSVAVLLANLCTRDGVLPQGAPTSPAVSNVVCDRLDRRLAGLAASRGFRYSRYADDMTFSSNDPRITSLIPFIRRIIEEAGFRVRDDKTRVARAGARHTVTGIVVNERPNLPREQVRRLRAAAHRLAHDGPEAVVTPAKRPHANPLDVLAGHAGFLAMVNPARGRSLQARFVAPPRR